MGEGGALEATDRVYARGVQLRRCGFERQRQGDGWARRALVVSDATLAAMDDATWAQYLKIWRQQRRDHA